MSKSWPINKWITLVDDGPQAVTFDLEEATLSLLAADVPKVIAALTEWLEADPTKDVAKRNTQEGEEK